MASITSVTGMPKYISWGESFPVDDFTFTVKLGSGEQITDSGTSYCTAAFFIGNYATEDAIIQAYDNARYYESDPDKPCFVHTNNTYSAISSRWNWHVDDEKTHLFAGYWYHMPTGYVPFGRGNMDFMPKNSDDIWTISKGGSKAFYSKYYGDSYSPASDPDPRGRFTAPYKNTDYVVSSSGMLPEYLGSASEAFSNFLRNDDGTFLSSAPVGILVTVGDWNRSYTIIKNNVATFIYERIAPDVLFSEYSDSDTRNAYGKFGSYVQNNSSPAIRFSCEYSKLDPDISMRVHELVLTKPNGTTVTLTEIVESDTPSTETSIQVIRFDVGNVDQAGTYSWVYTATDSQNLSDSVTGSFEVLPYYSPRFYKNANQDFVTRWGELVTEEGPIHVEDDLGENVWLSYFVDICPITGANGATNTWSLSVYWATGQTPAQIDGGTQGEVVEKDKDETLIPDTFINGEDFSFTFILQDRLNTLPPPTDIKISAGTGYFDVRKYGVSIGKLSKATPDNPKFECYYPAFFYGGIDGSTGDMELVATNTSGQYAFTKKVGSYSIGESETGTIYETDIYDTRSHNFSSSANWDMCLVTDNSVFTNGKPDFLLELTGCYLASDGGMTMISRYQSSSQYINGYINTSNYIRLHGAGLTASKTFLKLVYWIKDTTT